MPLKSLKYTFDYCKTNLLGFTIILILLFSINYLNENADYYSMKYQILFIAIASLITIFIYGYGMVITKDIIKRGEKLPKIKIRECLIYGIKSFIIIVVYSGIQTFLLIDLAKRFYFPQFDLKQALLNIPETLKLFYVDNPLISIEFIVFSLMITYIFIFFMEISLARLADGGKLRESFNILKIKRCIDTIGWKKYTLDYTRLLISITILAYLQHGINFFGTFDYIISTIISLLIFIIEYIGIGAIYKEYKIKKYSELSRPARRRV